MSRYERNHPAISLSEQEGLSTKRVLVAGCGGLGGYIIEFLGRTGVGHITALDGDVFTESNLNRQLLSDTKSLGQAKPLVAARRMSLVNPQVNIRPVCENITEANALSLTAGYDVIVDALDNGPSRALLARAAGLNKTPLVSGAISGWRGRVFILMPGDNAELLWSGASGISAGNLCFTASAAASIQAAETVKLLINRGGRLHGKILEFDLLSGLWEEIPLEL
jgi:molybdopterin/thiamine biosynthesis adenylyltransferase